MSTNNQSARSYASSLNVPHNGHSRSDCPICGGSNTFSVSNNSGKLTWFCFKASCGTRGADKSDIQTFDIKRILSKPKDKRRIRLEDIGATFIKPVDLHPVALHWLLENNCEAALKTSPNCFKYDVKQNRVVFLNYVGPYLDVMIGRSLEGAKPKWIKYYGTNGYFVCDLTKNGKVFIVEDCASACSLGRFGTAIALCGTNYDISVLNAKIRGLSNITEIHVSLDADARTQAMDLTRDLAGYTGLTAKTLMLSDDAKYLSYATIKKELAYLNWQRQVSLST